MSPTNDNCHVWTFKLKIVWNFWWIRWKNCLYWVYFKFFVCTRRPYLLGKKIENGVFPSKLGSKFGFLCPIDFFLSFYKQQKTSVAEMSYLCCAASLHSAVLKVFEFGTGPSLNTQSCIRRPLCSTFKFENLRSPKKTVFTKTYFFKNFLKKILTSFYATF